MLAASSGAVGEARRTRIGGSGMAPQECVNKTGRATLAGHSTSATIAIDDFARRP
jgi:hypothetical protein